MIKMLKKPLGLCMLIFAGLCIAVFPNEPVCMGA